MVVCCLDLCGSGYGLMTGFCEHGNEFSGSINIAVSEVAEGCCVLKKDSAAWTQDRPQQSCCV
jgi:hypothetical protein